MTEESSRLSLVPTAPANVRPLPDWLQPLVGSMYGLPAGEYKRVGSSVVTPALVKKFAELSGDWSPLHFDAAAAAKFGFEGPIVPGHLLLILTTELFPFAAMFTQAGITPQRRSDSQVKYKQPLLVGGEVVGEVRLDLWRRVTDATVLLFFTFRLRRSDGANVLEGAQEVVVTRNPST